MELAGNGLNGEDAIAGWNEGEVDELGEGDDLRENCWDGMGEGRRRRGGDLEAGGVDPGEVLEPALCDLCRAASLEGFDEDEDAGEEDGGEEALVNGDALEDGLGVEAVDVALQEAVPGAQQRRHPEARHPRQAQRLPLVVPAQAPPLDPQLAHHVEATRQ